MKITEIELTSLQLKFAREVGAARHMASRGASVFNARRSPRSDEFIDANGAAGEIALNSLLLMNGQITELEFYKNIDRLRDVSPKSALLRSDEGDLTRQGERVDVKTTHYPTGNLIVQAKKLNCVIDSYALVVGDIDQSALFSFKGKLSKEELEVAPQDGSGSIWVRQDRLTIWNDAPFWRGNFSKQMHSDFLWSF